MKSKGQGPDTPTSQLHSLSLALLPRTPLSGLQTSPLQSPGQEGGHSHACSPLSPTKFKLSCKHSLRSSPWPPTGVSLLCRHFSQPLNFSFNVGGDRLTFSETPWRFSPPGHSGSPLSPASGLVLCEQVLLPFSSCDGIAAIPGSGEEADKAGLRLSCIHISPGRKTHFQS